MKKRLPRAKQTVMTEFGRGVIHSVDVINRKAIVELEDTNRKTFAVDDIIVDDGSREFVDTHAAPIQLWEDKPERHERNASDQPKKKRRRRRRKGDGNKSESVQKKENSGRKKEAPKKKNSGAKPQNEAAGDAKPKKKRRRRRRKPKGDSAKKPDPKN